jgi:multiple sugar transport system substrate-binding protein
MGARAWLRTTATIVPLVLLLASCGTGDDDDGVGAVDDTPAGEADENGEEADGDFEAVPEDGEVLVEAAEDAEEIVFWTSHTNPNDVSALTQIVENFNAENDDVQISMVQVPGDETDVAKLMTAVRAGVGPDIYLLDRFTVAERAAAGVLESLADHVDPNLGDDYVDYAWQEVLFEGEPYGLPFDTDVRALWYRSDLLEEAGIDHSALDPANGPPTLAEVKEIADQFDETDDRGYVQVGFIPWFEQGWHYTWGFVHGGEFFDPGSCEVTPTHPGVLAAYQFMYDWAQEKGPSDLQAFIDTYAPEGVVIPPEQQPFITGHVAMMISGEWWIQLLERYGEDVEYEVTYIPVAEEGDEPTTWSGGWSVVIPAGTENVDNAVRALSYMAGPEGQEECSSM